MKTALALLFALVVVDQARAQTAQAAPAADITNTEIQAAVQKTTALPVSDQQLRMVSIKGEYNVGAAVVHRAKRAGQELGGALAHSQITEAGHEARRLVLTRLRHAARKDDAVQHRGTPNGRYGILGLGSFRLDASCLDPSPLPFRA